IRFRGTNRKFALSMDIHRAWYLPNYKHEFTPEGENWQEITVPLTTFKETRIGEFTGNTMSNEQLSKVIQMGFILYDKQSGPFELEVDYIKFE
ncbi:MAG: CIA30 family protein, partial [Flavobacteriaceae bacterium]|nr:CIA30 family protein [Flavobacteriaceae bacterium]